MNTLHLLNESPFNNHAIAHALTFANVADGILLMGDAVYALTNQALQSQLKDSPAMIYALEEDVHARAISADAVDIVNYDRFVILCTQYKKVVSW